MKNTIKIILLICITSCNHHINQKDNEILDKLYHDESKPIGELLACGCKEGTATEPIFTTIFYPKPQITRYLFYKTDSLISNPNDLIAYREFQVQIDSIFKGKLLRIDQKPMINGYVKVVGVSQDTLFISDAIKVKFPLSPSRKSPDYVKVQDSDEKPIFEWNNKAIENSKSFLVLISNESEQIRSCIYTKNKQFEVDKLSSAERVMYPIDEQVNIDGNGSLLWMAVDQDNWITHLAQLNF